MSAAGFAENDLLLATMHRKSNAENGPVISVLSNHAFTNLTGSERLSNPDRQSLITGNLYIRIATRSGNMRIPLNPPSAN